jgi:hypothetical protein
LHFKTPLDDIPVLFLRKPKVITDRKKFCRVNGS